MSDLQHLRRDIARLTTALEAAVTKLGGPEAHVLCRQLGLAAQELRAGTLAGGREAFGAAIGKLDHGGLEDLHPGEHEALEVRRRRRNFS